MARWSRKGRSYEGFGDYSSEYLRTDDAVQITALFTILLLPVTNISSHVEYEGALAFVEISNVKQARNASKFVRSIGRLCMQSEPRKGFAYFVYN